MLCPEERSRLFYSVVAFCISFIILLWLSAMNAFAGTFQASWDAPTETDVASHEILFCTDPIDCVATSRVMATIAMPELTASFPINCMDTVDYATLVAVDSSGNRSNPIVPISMMPCPVQGVQINIILP